MRKILLIFCLTFSLGAQAQYVTIPDMWFRNHLQQLFPLAFFNGQMDTTNSDIVNATVLDASYAGMGPDVNPNAPNAPVEWVNSPISSLDGIQYFDNLIELNCGNNNLTSFPNLPGTLQILKCRGNDLSTLGNLPLPLKLLDCSYNQLVSLPNLPALLETLYCQNNPLTSLPALPNTLIDLQTMNTQIGSYPVLPTSLKYFYTGGNNFAITLPALPANLEAFECNTSPTSLPVLPPALIRLKSTNCGLTVMPALPATLKSLICNNNQLASMPSLPNSLDSLICNYNLLGSMPPFPPTLKYLNCASNQLSSLPALSNVLRTFFCDHNQLTSLPLLSDSLKTLWCQNNQLTSLPPLSNILVTLYCHYNQLTSLPPLPNTLNALWCHYNQLTSLPSLSTVQNSLYCNNNPLLSCLPLIPATLMSLGVQNTAITCIPNPGYNGTLFGLTLCPNGSPCETAPSASGTVFLDINNNGVYEAGNDSLLRNWLITNTNGWVATTNTNGQYQIKLDSGVVNTFQLNLQILYSTFTPANYTITPLTGGSQGNNFDFAVHMIPNVNDLTVHIAAGRARPGFNQWVSASVNNAGTTVFNNTTLKVLMPGGFTFTNATPPITSQNGDTLIWSNFNMNLLQQQGFNINWSVPANAVLGTPYNIQAWVTPVTNDTTPLNNHTGHPGVITSAIDPNDKTVVDTITYLNGLDKELLYTIRFQNTGTDTAFNIVLRDELSENLDLGTFRRVGASHNNTFLIREKSLLEVFFTNIQLPDSNVNEPLSHGFFQYAVKPKATLALGDSIKNKADIYFDYNIPVVTNQVNNVVHCNLPVPVINSNSPVCEGDSLIFGTDAGMNTYSWSGPNGYIYNLESDFLAGVTVLANGIYTVVISDATGCTNAATALFNVREASSSTIDTSACVNITINGQTYMSSGTYTQTLTNAGGCDSVITINLDILQPSATTIVDSACDIYTLNGQTYAASGTYYQNYNNASGCDSVLTLELTIKQPTANTINQGACISYTLNGQTYNTSGMYTQVLPNAAGCDSTITLNLIIEQPTTSSITDTACNSYTVNGQTYTSSGIYTQVIPNAAGCDSTITLNLTINQETANTITQSACNSFTLNAQTYNTSGTYTQMFTNAAGCDSTLTLNLTINQETTNTITQSACNSYTLNAQTYNASGIYTQMFTNAVGCDSVLTLNLTINQPTGNTLTQTACNSYTLNAQTYNTSGIYTQMFTNAVGCDSVLTLNLTIDQSTGNTFTQTACNSYALNAQTYNTSGIYTQMFTNAMGCDSIVTLNLTINNANAAVTQAGANLSAVANGAIYQWLICNPYQEIVGETNQNFTAVVNGDFALKVTQNGCTDTSACYPVIGLGVNTYDISNSIILFPNPATDNLNIQYNLINNKNAVVQIIDILGRLVMYINLPQNVSLITVSMKGLQPGVYSYKCLNNNILFKTGKVILK